ncbi:MAG: hypothetical protein ABIY70_17455 [Capsulimonas sp.]|uniref:hypothetical protein n=1 Tax=Capsulimonas sp. TaxID=2494211 RepID=UPI0032663373
MHNVENGVVRVLESALWQKALGLFIFLIMGGISVDLLFAIALPAYPAHFVTKASVVHDPKVVCEALAVLAVGFYIWWGTVRFRIIANDDGITATSGFWTWRVRWKDMHSYRIENLGAKEARWEPVILDADRTVLFKPFICPFLSTSSGDEERARFWQYVMQRIDRKYKQGRIEI